ncbi:hybrid sensor histidine kinase/response regulator [Polyangium jinanense]|uniref:histidine kinase n=1 Tax=Polyangium jinanense TaxID=2829994 RepID=A0A9X4AQ12_9BACT|nr:response regulator [Polyangium jinanense]MDC3952996.1 response regulator [Polyangium jinanense]MDC3980614.1 response regulator [Polyangium jinanense]
MNELEDYFRDEANEIVEGLTRDLLALEKNPTDGSILARCMRLAHTLKGAARVVRQVRIGEMAHTIEDALAPFRDAGETITSDYVSDLLRILERIREETMKLGATIAPGPASGPEGKGASKPAPPPIDDRLETVRVDIADMDALLEGLSEASIQVGPLNGGLVALQHALRLAVLLREELELGQTPGERGRSPRLAAQIAEITQSLVHAERDIGASLGRIERELGEVQSRAATLRLLPVGAILGTLELTTRDTAEALGKTVSFSARGGEVRLEGHVLSAVRDALLHVIRNAVDHGIEPFEERIGWGKPEVGRIHLEIERRGRMVAFRCSDDGRGIDVAAVRRAAVHRGLATGEEELDEEATLALVFRSGLTTAAEVTEISGRGVGLDVVREVASRLRGSVQLTSKLGEGTTIEIEVPVSLSSIPVLSVMFGGSTALVPLDAVRGTRRLSASERLQGPDGERILFGDRAVPFTPLGAVLVPESEGHDLPQACSAVIVQSGEAWIALGVDRLLGTMDVVLRPLPPGAGTPAAVAGAAFDAQGDPLLVLDPPALARTGARRGAATETRREAPKRLPILVIDDSLTTRMLEQSILESAGYEVDLSASAEEGLRKAKTRKYGLFIVDVEMPGMNGFEFTATTRADPALRDVPVIIVTSLATSKDREKGAAAGASAYIVKGEFDQKHFVRKVAELLGAAS